MGKGSSHFKKPLGLTLFLSGGGGREKLPPPTPASRGGGSQPFFLGREKLIFSRRVK